MKEIPFEKDTEKYWRSVEQRAKALSSQEDELHHTAKVRTIRQGRHGDGTKVFYPPPEEPVRTADHRKKDTKRWCRGRVGIEHDYQWKHSNRFTGKFELIEVKTCTQCQRQLFEHRAICRCCRKIKHRIFGGCKNCRDDWGQWIKGHEAGDRGRMHSGKRGGRL